MDVIILDPVAFLPVGPVFTGWDSLIWTERFNGNSEFELYSHSVTDQKAKLPLGTYISLVQSKEIMIVESHDISRDDSGVRTIKTTGRSLYSFYENREVRGNIYAYGNEESYSVPYYNTSSNGLTLAEVAAWVLYAGTIKQIYLVESDFKYVTDSNDLLPILLAFTQSANTEKAIRMQARNVTKLDAANIWLTQALIGIRTVRPPSSWNNIIDFGNTFDPQYSLSSVTATPKPVISMYKGVDRTKTVAFHNESGYLTNFRYLATDKGAFDFANAYAARLNDQAPNPQFPDRPIGNVTQIWSYWAFNSLVDPNTDPVIYPQKWNHRRLSIDATALHDPYGEDPWDAAFSRNPNSLYSLQYVGLISQLSRKVLIKQLKTRVVDAQDSPSSPYVYGDDFSLGDYVTVIEDYDISLTMRAIEYIRTQDKDGEKAWTAFTNRGLLDDK